MIIINNCLLNSKARKIFMSGSECNFKGNAYGIGRSKTNVLRRVGASVFFYMFLCSVFRTWKPA